MDKGNSSIVGGKSSSILLLLNLICFALAVTASKWITAGQEHPVPDVAVQVMLICMIWAGFFSMAVFFHRRNNVTYLKYVDIERSLRFPRNRIKMLKDYLPLIGVYVFAIGSIVLDILMIADNCQCFQVFRMFGEEPDMIVGISFHLSKIGFCIFQIVFIKTFYYAKCLTTSMKYFTFIILSANVSIWFYIFVNESSDKFVDGDGDGKQFNWINITKPNASHPVDDVNMITECLNGNTSLQGQLKKIKPYLHPFTLEYSLLAAGVLFDICAIFDEPPTELRCVATANDNDTSSRSSGIVSTASGNNEEEASVGERTHLLDSNVTRENSRLSLLFHTGLVITIVLIVMEALLYNEEIKPTLILPFHVSRVIFHSLLLATATFGLFKACQHTTVDTKYKADDLLLLGTAAGEFIYLYFGMTSSLGILVSKGISVDQKDTEMYRNTIPALLLATNALDIAEIVVQTILLICSIRIRLPHQRSTQWLKESLSYLAICNFGKWIMDSFIEGQFLDSNPTETGYYGKDNWLLITDITYPLCIFYRLHSLIVITHILSRL